MINFPKICPKCDSRTGFTKNVIRPAPTLNCKQCGTEFGENGILEIDIKKQYDEGREVIYCGKSLFISRKAFDMMISWDYNSSNS